MRLAGRQQRDPSIRARFWNRFTRVPTEAAKHLRAAEAHDVAADEHDRLAAQWHDQGDAERAGLELVIALFERHLALLERDRAEFENRRSE